MINEKTLERSQFGIRVTESLRNDLNLLKEIREASSINQLIRMLLESRGYTQKFFVSMRKMGVET